MASPELRRSPHCSIDLPHTRHYCPEGVLKVGDLLVMPEDMCQGIKPTLRGVLRLWWRWLSGAMR